MGGTGKKKIEIKKLENKNKMYATFSKRRNGLFKIAEELALLPGCNLAAIVFSPTAKKPYTAGTLSVIDKFINDTTSESQVDGLMRESEVEVALRVLAATNVEEVWDLNELVEMRSVLERIKESLLQHLNSRVNVNV